MTLNNKNKVWKHTVDKWRAQGIDLSIFGSEHQAHIYILEVPEELRGKGIASKVMKDITELADYHNITLTVNPSDEFGSDLNRLKQFYGKFDFVPLGVSMIRRPNLSKVYGK